VGFKRQPALFMAPGDLVEVEVSGIGILSNRVQDESPA
jgi:2-keto-4-pentenoate hydratase/2-oxohepta-3-ene-1,7-dioic acid hydratase in catechol pathway